MNVKYISALLSVTLFTACSTPAPVAPPAPPPPVENEKTAPPQMSEKEMMDLWKKVSTPSAKHALLKAYVGTWKTESKFWKSPSQPPEITKGTSTFTSLLGGRFVQQDFKGKIMGMPFMGRGLMGYDNAQERFVSTWVDSAGTGLMTSSGTLDSSGKSIALNGEFFCPMMKQMVHTREVLTLVDKKSFVFEMFGPGMDGKEAKMLEITYRK